MLGCFLCFFYGGIALGAPCIRPVYFGALSSFANIYIPIFKCLLWVCFLYFAFLFFGDSCLWVCMKYLNLHFVSLRFLLLTDLHTVGRITGVCNLCVHPFQFLSFFLTVLMLSF